MERGSYERWCGGAMVAVYPTSMLFGGGSNRCSVAVSLAGILVFSRSVQVILSDLGVMLCWAVVKLLNLKCCSILACLKAHQ